MAGMSELKAAQDACSDSAACDDLGAAENAPAITALVALAEVVRANPKKVAQLGSECRAQLQVIRAKLESSGRLRLLPLLTEVEQTLDAVAASPGANACDAIASAMDLLANSLKLAAPPPRAREMVAIAELRSLRGAPAPWRAPFVDCSFVAAEPEVAAQVSAGSSPEFLSRALAAYRKSLLRLLKADSSEEAKRLSELSRRVAQASGGTAERRQWQAAGALFDAAVGSGDSARPLVKRIAVKLEQGLRNLSENLPANEQSRRDLIGDLEVLTTFLRQNCGPGVDDTDAGYALEANPEALKTALERVMDAPAVSHELLAQIADAFLVDGKYDHWLEARQLADRPGSTEALRAAVSRWNAGLLRGGETESASSVSTHFAQAQAALGRIEGGLKPAGGAGDSPMQISGIPVDDALLENLNLMAREIRGARSRAEANLGSLRGGLVDMERGIRSLRSQLESLEVESHAQDRAPSGSESETRVESKFVALSRGIEELAGLKDALQALTEEAESALAAQADDDARLEQGLLKTRMMPVAGCFDALSQCVQRSAAECGLVATLSTRGAAVALERSQVDALIRALETLLQACVGQGMAARASPVPGDPSGGRIELEVSQPRFDVCVDISYHGAPLPSAVLADLAPALDALGAVIASSVDGDGRARLNLLLPGPQQSMDLLLVEVGKSRFALPLKDVSGVSRPPGAAAAPEGKDEYIKVEHELYRLTSLARVLDLEATDDDGSVCVLVARGQSRLACRVDSVIGRERMLVGSPGPLLSSNPWVLGAVVDTLAAPVLVLDLGALEITPASAAG